MEGPFPGVMNQGDQSELGNSHMIIQQHPRYPTGLEPTIQSAPLIGSTRGELVSSSSPPIHHKRIPRSLQSSPTGLRSTIPASSARLGPSASPPQTGDLAGHAESRSLPSRDLTNETIDNAYIAFILYCNPSVPSSANTYELRRCFRCPPRSDGKNFNIFTLWQLIGKLDRKELKTWIQLSIELGVERPSLEKKQSAQKVQQYAVRLKRWMRAMHVDAFFEYCLGHAHPYYTELPHSNTFASESRDGVPLEEDLALRALVPESKPKRGRKRTEGGHGEGGPSKRPQLDTSDGILHAATSTSHSVVFPQSAIPFSAFPDDMESNDPWVAAASSFAADGSSDHTTAQKSQEFRWRPLERDMSPSGHPQSAIIPRRYRNPDILPATEPRSALTPSSDEKPRSRRRHGPAVSSAWLSNSGSLNGKTRGRPPSKGSVSGPFSSFPVNPNRIHTQGQKSAAKSPPRIVLDDDPAGHQPHTPSASANARPGKLQLQVPQHLGAPVRLATPPTLLLNGNDTESLQTESHANPLNSPFVSPSPNPQSRVDGGNRSKGDPAFDDVVRILSRELLAGKIVGRSYPLRAGEAEVLASSVVTSLVNSYSASPVGSPVLMAALHLGQGHHFGTSKVASGSVTVNVNPGTIDEGFAMLGDNQAESGVYTLSFEYEHPSGISTKVTFSDIHVGDGDHPDVTAGKGNEDVKEQDETANAEFGEDIREDDVSETRWKQRYMKLRAQLQKKERALSQYKLKILESVMADI